ncbi:uncharacterized protein LOC112346170 [Selaginella moellendorffii]|uniref:uncharacterized protein LOC112346170 n=1 Tax=Selaginella moellendorffii TaxID=88036 RepID=UPI000D1C8789|nr:uncharacterized protein LOC112346170 [Selaginella moellendorffii]|eukprot:XP_024530224.1 uncharacterized protein LOC112346170 [Selaginella moellendorffii]
MPFALALDKFDLSTQKPKQSLILYNLLDLLQSPSSQAATIHTVKRSPGKLSFSSIPRQISRNGASYSSFVVPTRDFPFHKKERLTSLFTSRSNCKPGLSMPKLLTQKSR